jgi:TetR/AcrR family transcriptional regulator
MADSRTGRTPERERVRDAQRTKRALLDAALAEFSDKGLAGARVSAIAQRAGVNKQLISYYFGGKDGLYRSLTDRWLEQEADFARAELPLADVVAAYAADGVRQRDLHRLFVRECLEDNAASPGLGPGSEEVEDLRRRQAAGELDAELDPALLLLALQGAASAAIVYPGDVRALTGLEPDSPEFGERYGELLRRVVELLSARVS